MTTDDFDATTLDHTTVCFGPDEASEAHRNRRGPIRHEYDVDGDGDLDLMFHFRLADTGIQCGDTEVTLTGATYDGRQVTGTDFIRTGPKQETKPTPERLVKITPNPFNPMTTISFKVEDSKRVHVAVYDIRGRLVADLTDQQYATGDHGIVWKGRDSTGREVPSGAYFFRVEMGDQVETQKAILLR